MMIIKMKWGEVVCDGYNLSDINFPPDKFTALPVIIGDNVENCSPEIWNPG